MKQSIIPLLGAACLSLAFASPAPEIENRAALLGKMDQGASHFGDLSRQIWEFAEVGYKEARSSELLKSELRGAGFRIQDNVGGIPTAFTAGWGQGKPVIAIMGEFDALPGLSQEAVPEKKPRTAGMAGHGCGHSLLGAAAAFASVVIKDYLADKKLSGTIRFYGTPAEEGGGGKIYMARAGAFQDCDAARASFNKRRAGHEYRSRIPPNQKPPLNYRDK